MPRRWSRVAVPVVLVLLAAAPAWSDDLDDQVTTQLEELGSPRPAERRAAEETLVALAKGAPDRAERVLAQLPTANATIPREVMAAIERVRIRVQRHVAQRATAASTVTLQVAQAPLAEVLAEFTRQTGARFEDRRQAFGGAAPATPVTLSLRDEPFWPAVDKLLDETKLSIYPFGDDGALTLVDRDAATRRRVGAAAYAGPFRFEPISLSATRGLRDPDASRLDLSIEAAWEPRLRPIAISQPLSAVTVRGSGDVEFAPRMEQQSIDLEATPGEQSLTMTLSMQLPDRKVERIERVAGQLTAMIPATSHEFRVENVGAAELPVRQTFGDATVTVNRFRKVNAIWELHMRLRLAEVGDALASHRGWVFQNKSYLVRPDGKRVEHAGFETTMQTANEIGLAYLFDLSGGGQMGFEFEDDAADEDGAPEELDPKTLTWVYETATGVYTVPVAWELGPIDLP